MYPIGIYIYGVPLTEKVTKAMMQKIADDEDIDISEIDNSEAEEILEEEFGFQTYYSGEVGQTPGCFGKEVKTVELVGRNSHFNFSKLKISEEEKKKVLDSIEKLPSYIKDALEEPNYYLIMATS